MADLFEAGSTDWLTGTIDTFTPRENVASPITDSVRRVDKNWVNPLAQAIIDIQGYLQPPTTFVDGVLWYFDAGNKQMKSDSSNLGMKWIETATPNNTNKRLRVGELEVGSPDITFSDGDKFDVMMPTDKTFAGGNERAYSGMSLFQSGNSDSSLNPTLRIGYEAQQHVSGGAGRNWLQFEADFLSPTGRNLMEINWNMTSVLSQSLRWMHFQKNRDDFTTLDSTGFIRMDDMSLETDPSITGGGGTAYRHFRGGSNEPLIMFGKKLDVAQEHRVSIFVNESNTGILQFLDSTEDWQVQFFKTASNSLLIDVANNSAKQAVDWKVSEFNIDYETNQNRGRIRFKNLPAAQNWLYQWADASQQRGGVLVQGGILETWLVANDDLSNTPLAVNVDTNRISLGTGAFQQFFLVRETETLTASPADGFAANVRLDPGYSADTAEVVTRHNYIDYQNVSVAGLGPAAVTDACIGRFDAAAGTHKAVDGATTKTSPGSVDAWVKWNVNGTVYFQPLYTSKTS